MKRCMYCGHENSDDAATCDVCGNKLGAAIPTAEVVTPEDVMKKEDPAASGEADPGATKVLPNLAEGMLAGEKSGLAADEMPAEEMSSGSVPEEDPVSEDAAMTTQPPAFEGQVPVNEQFGDMTPGGHFVQDETPSYDATPGYGADWRQDVGRGQTYGARQQYEASREGTAARPPRDQYGQAGYGYRSGGPMPQEGGRDYGRRENVGGSKTFMIRARKRVKSVSFFLMAFFFTLMVAANIYNIYTGNMLRNINELSDRLTAFLGGTDANFMSRLVVELGSEFVSMIVNIEGNILQPLGPRIGLILGTIFLIPNVLYIIGLWMMFGQTDLKRRQFPMGGYNLAKIMLLFKFLLACALIAVGLVIAVYNMVVGAQYSKDFTDPILLMAMGFLILMILAAIFVVMYFIQWMFCLKVVKVNVKTGADPGRMPAFVAILSFICAGITVLLMLPMAPNDYVGLAARGTAALYFVFFGLWVFLYKLKVKRS